MIIALAIAAILLTAIALLYLRSRKEIVPEACDTSVVTKPFYQMGVHIARYVTHSERLRQLLFSKSEDALRLLEPTSSTQARALEHFAKKIALSLLFLSVGIVAALLLGYQESQENLLTADGTLMRGAIGKGRYSATLDALVGEESFPEIEISVAAQSYTEAQLREMLPAYHEALESAFLAGNASPDHISQDVALVSSVSGYPFSVEWRYSDHSLMDSEGHLRADIPDHGALLTLEADSRCDGFGEIYQFSVMVYPRELSTRERLYESLQSALADADAMSATQEQLTLPSQVDGLSIVWTEDKKDRTLLFLLFAAILAVLIYVSQDRDLDKRLEKREAQMLDDYPEMVSKLVLYVGAGMTVRTAWKKLCEENRSVSPKEKRYIYEEMRLAMHEMESGIGELEAYQHFATRSRVQRYVKLVSLIEQSVKLGARGFLDSLQRESRDALEEKKASAKRKGEEAGTKLLLPMMLMLAIVMVVIIVPAFMGI